jgi:hypothetical protein
MVNWDDSPAPVPEFVFDQDTPGIRKHEEGAAASIYCMEHASHAHRDRIMAGSAHRIPLISENSN